MGKRSANDNTTAASVPRKKRARLVGQRRHPPRRNVHYEISETSEEESTSSRSSSESSATSIADNCKQSPKPEFQLTRDLVDGTILTDLSQKEWRIGCPVGKGSFGEIFLASDNLNVPVTRENAKYVAKIEPHSNGPLFVEIHCLLNTAKNTENDPLPPGMPEYMASGSHYFKDIRYRFLILRRYDCELHSIIKRRRVDEKSLLVLAVQILDILEHLHDKGYCHSDIKAENLMISKCTFRKSRSRAQDTSSEATSDTDIIQVDDSNDDDDDEEEEEDCENDDEDNASDYQTPTSWKKRNYVPYSGSNPVRSCRRNNRGNVSTYQEMVTTHYLRPVKKINYTEFDENSKSSEDCTLDEIISRQRTGSGTITRRHTNPHPAATAPPPEHKTSAADAGKMVTEDRIFLIDFGLASKFIDSSGVHRPFCMDQRRAHDGTLEYTSRDAHLGAHSRRSDLECLGYNLIYWSQGYLPWKENAAQQQHEKVHWMKEYLMTDVREMLKQVYGKSVPKYLGEYMHYVDTLAYHERPDYNKCRRIFRREYSKVSPKSDDMILNVAELKKKLKDVKEETENNNEVELKHLKGLVKNLGILVPFRENITNRVSPKNLRSKSEKQSKTKRKKFCWAEILSQDPDQIARERAEKEFERDPTIETPIIRYSGKPTYAILEIENRIKFKDRLEACSEEDEEILIKGYTKPMMEVLRKRQSALLADIEEKKERANHKPVTRTRAKAGLRTVITPTKRGLDYNNGLGQRRAAVKKRIRKNSGDFTNTDESSCSSLNSVASSTNSSSAAHSVANNGTKKSQYVSSSNSSLRGGGTSSFSCPSSSSGGGLSDDDTRDSMVFSPKRTRFRHQNHTTTTANGKTAISAAGGENGACETAEGHTVVGSKKRKKSIPMKRNSKEFNWIISKQKQTV